MESFAIVSIVAILFIPAWAEILMKVQENILSPRFGGAIIGGIHDHISGCFLLTHQNKRILLDDATHILGTVKYKDKIPNVTVENSKQYISGKDIFSTLLPNDLNIEFRAKTCLNCELCTAPKCPYDAHVIVYYNIPYNKPNK